MASSFEVSFEALLLAFVLKTYGFSWFSLHQVLIPNELHCRKPTYLTGFRSEAGEVACPVGFSTRGARSAYLRYVEHPDARKERWVRYIAGRSRKLVRYAG
jgi:hypothetical protein